MYISFLFKDGLTWQITYAVRFTHWERGIWQDGSVWHQRRGFGSGRRVEDGGMRSEVVRLKTNSWRLPSRELTYPPKNGILKMMFLFPRWDMLIPRRVYFMMMWTLFFFLGFPTGPTPSVFAVWGNNWVGLCDYYPVSLQNIFENSELFHSSPPKRTNWMRWWGYGKMLPHKNWDLSLAAQEKWANRVIIPSKEFQGLANWMAIPGSK